MLFEVPDISTNETTFLLSDYAAGTLSIATKNTTGFDALDFVVIGRISTSSAEIRSISTVGASLLGIDALVRAHAKGEPVTFIAWDQIKVYKATSKTGTYTLLDTINIEVDDEAGVNYTDPAGTSASWYKIKYYNSRTLQLSDYSAAVQGSGYTDKSLHSMVSDVYFFINDKKRQTITEEEVAAAINSQQKNWWLSPFTKRETIISSNVVTIANNANISLPATFDSFVDDYAVLYTYVPSASISERYCLRIVSNAEYYEKYADLLETSADELEYCTLTGTFAAPILSLYPKPKTAGKSITVRYIQKPVKLVNEDDETICDYPQILSLGAAAQIMMARGAMDKYKALKDERNELITGTSAHLRTKGGSTRMTMRKNYDRNRFKS